MERVEIKDVRLPIQLQRAMAAEAEATREARAKVIAAEGEHKASRALKQAADILNESPSAIQLRYLQTLNNIAAEKNSTIVFPIPIEFPLAIGGYNLQKAIQNKNYLNSNNNTITNSNEQRPESAKSANSNNNNNNSNTNNNNNHGNNSNTNSSNRKAKNKNRDATELWVHL